ncbi:YjzC family protein [Corallococcus praedator]|uniref:YjzC family protein n=1 Tax=Corallococcus praedator TaxID=2316724 RepID=A0ABX9QBA0_9BACT|nr:MULTISPECIES: YjzC family protein [Corallococcus]RKH03876.1 YjzC family protein [Corallococcus sp. CA047B]RKH32177.1 YjzC family protein [Corallococcus sp. CA031C]RKH94517.1 YjzC family protein [Corallococcus praedator]
MAKVGDRFKTGEKCETSGNYVFDGYVDGSTSPAPTAEERVIPLSKGETFPPIKSSAKSAYWKLQRIT